MSQRRFPYTPSAGPLAGHSFRSERQYRNALAGFRGYPSWYAQQRAPRLITSVRELFGLHPSERVARGQALEVLGLMRRERLSLEEAAAQADTTPNAVLRHVGSALRRDASGRYVPTATDRLYRRMRVLTTEGEIEIDTRGSGVASLIGKHQNAVKRYLATGQTTALSTFVGMKVRGHELETRPDFIDERERRGELSFEESYVH
jgi:hypothetical protein